MTKKTKWLIITEKPTVAADIAKTLKGFEKNKEYYESPEYYLTWAVGHLVEFLEPDEIDKKYKRWLLQDLPLLPEKFEYKAKKGQTERLNKIKSLAKKSCGYINACDAGREGELIFREIFDWCKQKIPTKRLWLQSLTPKSIRQEFSNLKDGQLFDNLSDAARSRSESDWLIGINATRAVTKRFNTRRTSGVWSVGRVQTPTLALLVKREFELLKHRPVPYFTLKGEFSASKNSYIGNWFNPKKNEHDERILSKEELNSILSECEELKSTAVASETRKESREIAPGLFDLTLLQRESNRRFGMTASRTLQAAQRLYEKHKLLTYPRTDSRYLPEDYLDKVEETLKLCRENSKEYNAICQKILSNGLLNKERVFNDKLVSDHFAIIPTGEMPSAKLDGDDARIYNLVFRRFLAAFMPHAVWDKVERTTMVGTHKFRTKAQDLKVSGWREAYGVDTVDESKLPKLSNNDDSSPVPVKASEFKSDSFLTKPPSRHSEAKLLSLMESCGKSVDDEELALALEEKGLGTPATRADIIENLINKEYIVRLGKTLCPTFKGIRLTDILSRIPVEMLAKVELTGEMEFDLKLMEKGQKKRTQFMKSMKDFTLQTIERIKSFQYDDLYKNTEVLGVCPRCHKGEVREEFWSYKCTYNVKKSKEDEDSSNASCDFILWKEKKARYVDPSLVVDLLKEKVIGPLDFPQMSGSGSFSEFLTLSPDKGIVFCSSDGVIKESEKQVSDEVIHEEDLKETFLKCPGTLKVTNRFYLCEFITAQKKKVISRMPKVLCFREMSLDEYKQLVLLGETAPIMDFKSKKGRTFAASLKLKANGNFEFKFVSRKKEKTSPP